MRARRAIWITAVVLVLAIGFLMVSRGPSEQQRMAVRVLGLTNEGTFYLIEATNSTREPHAFAAWIEGTANGPVFERVSETYGPILQPHCAHTFIVERPGDGKRCLTVACYPINDTAWKRWRFVAKAALGLGLMESRSYMLHVDVE